MRLDGRMQIQLALFTVIALVAMGFMTLHFMKLPAMLFDVGRYKVTVELATSQRPGSTRQRPAQSASSP